MNAQTSHLRAVQSGDRDAVARFVEEHESAVRRWVGFMMSGRGDEMRDVVQDTFVEALTCIKNLRGGSETVRPWLRSVTQNVVCRYYRSEHRRRWVETRDPEKLEELAGMSTLVDSRHLGDVLAQMPRVEAEALVMRHVHGLKLDEMAPLLRMSLSSVKRCLRRGQSRARGKLESQGRGLGPSAHESVNRARGSDLGRQ